MVNLYTETVFEAAPPTSASRISLQIPRANGSYDRSKFSSKDRKRHVSVTDEDGYASEYLASASSIYFRENKTYPRTFLWKVVSNEKVLEISCADFARSAADSKEAYLTLAFEFQDRISPRGIAFADQAKGHLIHAYVLTRTNEVFEIRLSSDHFRDAASIPQDVGLLCSPLQLSSLSIDSAYQIYAVSPLELFVSFTSGRVQRWRRGNVEEQWTQENYDERTWGSSFLSIVGRKGHPDIDFDGQRLAYNTVHALTASSSHLYTICLNHTLKVWDLKAGTLADTRDLLNTARDPQDRIQLSPSEAKCIRLIHLPGSSHQILATYSSHQGGQFKFWRIKHTLNDPFIIEDMFPKATLTPPDPDPTGNTVWALAGFEMVFDKSTKDWLIWIMWRNHNYHRTYSLNFTFPTLLDAWQENWIQCTDKPTREKPPDFVSHSEQDPTSNWLQYLLFPGRYSITVLEIALTRFQEIVGGKLSTSQRSKSLVERLCTVIASETTLRKYHDSDMDFDRFNTDVDQQWRNFWRIAENMNQARFAPLALSYDAYTDMPWITMTDACCAIRECSDLELVEWNEHDELKQVESIARERWSHRKVGGNLQGLEMASCVLQATDDFVQSFSPELASSLQDAVSQNLFNESEQAIPERVINMYNEIDLANAVSQEAESEFQKQLAEVGGLDRINDNLMDTVLHLLGPSKRPNTDSKLIKTVFGAQLHSAGVVAAILNMRRILQNLLVLTLFVDESTTFEASRHFEHILIRLRIVERNLWLSTHLRKIPLEFKVAAKDRTFRDSEPTSPDNIRTVSILDDLFGNTVPPAPAVNIPLTYLITSHIAENLEFISGDRQLHPDDATARLQCNLLRQKELHFAEDFERFLPPSSWSQYIKARLRLELGEHDAAAIYFRQASYNLAQGRAVGRLQEMSDGLLSILDAECFNNGMPRYFQHVMSLFETAKAFSQTAEFAQLALQALESQQDEAVRSFRQELLSRLFTAELKCSRFESAYQALIQFTDPALQKVSATALVNAMLDPQSMLSDGLGLLQSLQKLPWSLHPHLAGHLDGQLALLAKKQASQPGRWPNANAVDYLSILYALRLSKQDYRGAVSVLFDRLRVVQRSGRARHDPQATALRHALLALINAMTCVSAEDAYILTDANDDPRLQGLKRSRNFGMDDETSRKKKRVIVTLDDLRREYQMVLDRCNRIERGDFDFAVDGYESDEGEEDVQMVPVNGDSMQM